jgi:hypothetical protein
VGRGALLIPWARLVSDWGHQGLCLRVLGAHFGHNFAHFCMPGGARVTTGSIFEILTSYKFECIRNGNI